MTKLITMLLVIVKPHLPQVGQRCKRQIRHLVNNLELQTSYLIRTIYLGNH